MKHGKPSCVLLHICSLNSLILVVIPVLSDKGIGLYLSEVLRFVFRGILFTEFMLLYSLLNINVKMFAFEKSQSPFQYFALYP